MAVRLVHWLMDTPDITLAARQLKSRLAGEARAKRIASAYSGGMRVVSIQDEFGVSYLAIKKACIEHGVALRRNSWRYQ